MKTIKLIFAALLLAITVYSCSSEREDESRNPTSAPKMDLKKLKTNINHSENAKVGDSIILPPSKGSDAGEGLNPGDAEIIPPGDVKPPKKQ